MLDTSSLIPDETTRKQATLLAQGAGFILGEDDHNPTKYGELLCHLLVAGTDEKSISFLTVSRFVLGRVYKIREPKVLKRIAVNILAIIHWRDERVGEIEQDADVKQGSLAKIKDGKPLDLTPTQIVNFAVALRVPIGLFFEDFDNNPAGLRQAMKATPPPADEDDDAAVEEPVSLSEPASPFMVLTASIAPEPLVGVEQPAMEETPMPDASQLPEPPATITVSELLPKVPPATIARNVRAVAKQAGVTLTDLLKVIGVRNRRHLENIEKGEGAFSSDELIKMAEKLGVDAGIFYTGEGLDRYHKRPKTAGPGSSLVPIGAKKLPLPPISEEIRDDFFKSRCLHDDVEVTTGHKIGELLAAARSRDPVDWYTLWITVTVEGAEYQKKFDLVMALTKPWGQTMRAEFFTHLHAGMFPALGE